MKVITVGRGSTNDVVINDAKVSRVHLQIVQNDEGVCSVVDLGSSNGTFVNERKITGETKLQPSDVIRIGNTILPWSDYIKQSVSNSKETDAKNSNGVAPRPALNRKWIYIATCIVSLIALCCSIGWYSYHNKQKQKESQIISEFSDSINNLKQQKNVQLLAAYEGSDEFAKEADAEKAKREKAEKARDEAIGKVRDTKARARKDSINMIKSKEAAVVAAKKEAEQKAKAEKEDLLKQHEAEKDAAKRQHEADEKKINELKEQALRDKLEVEFIRKIEPQIKGNNSCLEDICRHFKITANNKERMDSIKALFDKADNQKRQEIIEVCNLAYAFESNLKKLKDSEAQQQLLVQLDWQDLLQEMYSSIVDLSGQKTFSFDSQKFRTRFADSTKDQKIKVVKLQEAAVNKQSTKSSNAQD